MPSVAIFGGGMAGLSAAHELIHRGYQVDVYESAPKLGGKNCNQGTGAPAPSGGRAPLVGEHGFRFFPGFYRHVVATMSEIPRPGGGTVADNLVPSESGGIAMPGLALHTFPRRVPLPSIDLFGRILRMYGDLGFKPEDLARMAWFRLKYITSGRRRRDTEYEGLPWWDFIEGDSPRYSETFRRFEASIPRTMSAMVARTSSARTIGDITMQMMLGYGRAHEQPDRLLMGPTDERLLNPWCAYLKTLGVTFHLNASLAELVLASDTKSIAKAVLAGGTDVQADHYVAALPVEAMKRLISNEIAAADAQLAHLRTWVNPTSWMVGIQLFLRSDSPLANGHVFLPESEWSLTCIAQGQFWALAGAPVRDRFGDGTVNEILSVILSDWDTPGALIQKPARACKHAEIVQETLAQLGAALGNQIDLGPGNVAHVHLDDSIVFNLAGDVIDNRSPLLVHPVDSWQYRPTAHALDDQPHALPREIPNLFLASDYVRTNTQLATMEGANEAARRAVNAILAVDDAAFAACPIWPLAEEPIFEPAKRLDDRRFAAGRPHLMDEFPFSLGLEAPAIATDVLQALIETPEWLLASL